MDILYFRHDFYSRNDPRLIKLSKQGWQFIGLYWSIIEMLHEQGGYLNYDCDCIAYALRTDSDSIATVINTDLFVIDGNKFTSNRVLENLNKMNNKRDKARQSARRRWDNANAMPTQCERNARREEKRREENINTYVLSVFDYFVLKTKKSFRLTKDKVELIQKRIDEGYTVDQLKTAIDNFIKDDWPDRKNHLDLIYCIGKQKGKPDNLERWLNFTPEQKGIKL